MGLVATETACPIVRHNFFEKIISCFWFGWPSTIFWKAQERSKKLAKNLAQPNTYATF